MDIALTLASGLLYGEPVTEDTLKPPPLVTVAQLEGFIADLGTNLIKLPDYQRPYVWETEKIDVLLKDLTEFSKEQQGPDYYYIGALLFHLSGNEYNIVDGQQRLTTLLILDFELNGANGLMQRYDGKLQMSYNSPVSVENIGKNRDYIRKRLDEEFNREVLGAALEKIIFTAIVTPSVDDAFVYFDSQNNRGVSLGAVDFLKAYHLRAVKADQGQDMMQSLLAKQWDRHNSGQFLEVLFSRYLWRTRKWKGNKIYFEDSAKVLKEFQKYSRPNDGTIKIYGGPNNKSITSLTYSEQGKVSTNEESQTILNSAADYPFSLRQPIQKGPAFFLYADKYTSLYGQLFRTKSEAGSELAKMRYFYDEVYIGSGLSAYLKEFFVLCILHYYDRFGQDSLFAFSLWLDHLLGSYRIKQDSIVAQTPVKIVRDKQRNLLDVIQEAYEPDEIINFIKSITIEADYEGVVKEKGVKADYKAAVQKYYNKTTSLTEKRKWIYEHIKAN